MRMKASFEKKERQSEIMNDYVCEYKYGFQLKIKILRSISVKSIFFHFHCCESLR